MDHKVEEKKDYYRDRYWKQSKIFDLEMPFLFISEPKTQAEKAALSQVISEIEKSTGKNLRLILLSKQNQ